MTVLHDNNPMRRPYAANLANWQNHLVVEYECGTLRWLLIDGLVQLPLPAEE
jgi:hypothetical protein